MIINDLLKKKELAAMFGVGRNTIIPPGTKSIKVSVTFTHTSDIQRDTTPEMKSWTSQEIYSNEYGLESLQKLNSVKISTQLKQI